MRKGRLGVLERIHKGDEFGYWQVIGIGAKTEKHMQMIRCRCICGKVREIRHDKLENGRSQSCGCKRGDLMMISIIANRVIRNGSNGR